LNFSFKLSKTNEFYKFSKITGITGKKFSLPVMIFGVTVTGNTGNGITGSDP